MAFSLKRRLQRGAACLGAMTAIAVVPLALTAEPAAAAWPATIKICNASDSSDTNGGAADGDRIDVDRLSSSSYGSYSNELLPGDCTGAVNDPANVRIDYTDDGANTGLDSVQKGVDEDGIDDSQGPWDGGCLDTNAISNENAWPIPQSLAEHVISPNGIDVRIRDAELCGANLADHVRTCNDPASVYDIDVFKLDGSDSGTELDYNNELKAGECTNWKDADGTNPLRADLSDDGANAVVEWKINSNGGTWSACERDDPVTDADTNGGEDYKLTNHTQDDGASTIIHATRNIRMYANGSGSVPPTLCGTSAGSPEATIGALPPDANPTTGQFAGQNPTPGADPTGAMPGMADEGAMSDTALAGQADDS